MKKLIKESGIRDINRLKKEFDDVIIVDKKNSSKMIMPTNHIIYERFEFMA